jgi:Protein of Unknown function (DUF2784)
MSLLADLILATHFGFVLFVVGGLVLTWAGAALGWRWVRNFWFRIAHLGAILFVAGQTLLGFACPLTVWEDRMRGGGYGEAGFIARWVHRILFWSLPEWVFATLYVLFAALVALTLWRIPPRRPANRRNHTGPPASRQARS